MTYTTAVTDFLKQGRFFFWGGGEGGAGSDLYSGGTCILANTVLVIDANYNLNGISINKTFSAAYTELYSSLYRAI